MKIALVHDYLREYGGAERVLEAMHEMWPEAPLYTSFVDRQALGQHWKRFVDWDIRTSWVQRNWFVKKFISPLRFLAPKVWENVSHVSGEAVWPITRFARFAYLLHPSSAPQSLRIPHGERPSEVLAGAGVCGRSEFFSPAV